MTENSNSIKEKFSNKATHYQEILQKLEKKHALVSAFRIIIFLTALVLTVWLTNARLVSGVFISLSIFLVVFILLVKYHNKLTLKRDNARALMLINQQELQRLEYNFTGIDTGLGFLEKSHPYIKDLDVFGEHSIYQFIQRSETPNGRATLAHWLKRAASGDEIILRQQAVKELMSELTWRQNFQAAGMTSQKDDSKIETLLSWINEPNEVLHKTWPKILSYLLPVLALTSLSGVIWLGTSVYFFIGMMVVNGVVLKRFAEYTAKLTEKTSAGIEVLGAYGRMISHIEDNNFKAPMLLQLRNTFIHENVKASASILKLNKVLDYLQSRANWFYSIFNLIFLTDIHLVLSAEKWKNEQQADVNKWFESIGQLEALSSLAAVAYANPDYNFPIISGDGYHIKTEALGHPLISPAIRVTNDLEMNGRGTINIITGSNMSGKSTFLRTLGVNVVMALAGAPVCAKEMETSVFQIFTSMRTEDNLEDNTSSFYAELKRIRSLLDLLKESECPVLFMLDEILKGTNSIDRHKGASGLVRQLVDENALGFVSTHDLDLGQLENELKGVKNYSFNSIIENDEIIFNYKLEEGLCKSFNASKLMEKIGIKIQ
ncbi:MutS-related protein [Fulvivirga sediminis]|uniref:DNA mismatch repair protein MutS n=1 Tax=Fulvivirga sediminis TaxID=2803949 RepID=A0A937JYV2_9BACT|nr:DNA mismatch repair protein MutS [Fulvivirga sediminis]MBL3654625.1 DNA mismatch repair protein MutS [Fulvivirga sediminis]